VVSKPLLNRGELPVAIIGDGSVEISGWIMNRLAFGVVHIRHPIEKMLPCYNIVTGVKRQSEIRVLSMG
jgi:hypothetical protein